MGEPANVDAVGQGIGTDRGPVGDVSARHDEAPEAACIHVTHADCPAASDDVDAGVVDKPLEEWERVIRVNLTGVMLSNQAAARRMIKAGNGGSIVNVSSIAAIGPSPRLADYSVSKAGVLMLTRVLALELAPYKIRVNCVLPMVILIVANRRLSSLAGACLPISLSIQR